MTSTRLNRLYTILERTGLDALALNPGPSLTYLTGLTFHLMERPVVILLSPHAEPTIVLPELETGKIADAPYPIRTCAYGDNPERWSDAFRQAAALTGLDGKKIGVEPTRMRFLELGYLETAFPHAQLIGAANALASLRIIKDAEEVAAMREAAGIAQRALAATLPTIHVGTTEREIAAELTLQLLRAGSDSALPFQPIIASGPNGANPHAVPGDRPVVAGDLIVIDWGAAVRGYFSDLTRTLAVGEVDPELQRIAAVVKEANQAGRDAGHPGLSAGAVDQAARTVIESAGYGKYFTHRTGHGLGIEEHEEPYMYADNELKLTPGMVYTVEPGIYLPGRAGVRIEDDVVVTETGSESLSDMDRDLLVVG